MITENEVRQYVELARQLARDGGMLAKMLVGKTRSSIKSDKSVVTEADHRVQDLLVERLAKELPSHGLIAEENTAISAGRPKGDQEFVWTIDPIDGTRNYASGVSIYCCSVALMHQGKPIAGAIYEPNFDWLFSAGAGLPAMFNDQPAKVRSREFCPETVFGLSINTYAYRPSILHQLLDRCMLRNLGATALHLGMVAAGLLDGAVHFGGKLWDIAAGTLIIEQAQGAIQSIDADGKFIAKSLWPLDLANYRNEPLPFVAGNAHVLASLGSI